MNDNELWQQLRNGDEGAYTTIYKAHVQALHRYGSQFGLDSSQVSDCLHDLFVEIWSKRQDLAPNIANMRSYLIKSLRRRLVRTIQKNKKMILSDVISEDNLDFELSHDTLIIEDEIMQERYALLNSALKQLSHRQREALYLRFYQDLSYQEVAQIMDLEQQSAYNLIFRGIEALRKVMGGLWLSIFLSFL